VVLYGQLRLVFTPSQPVQSFFHGLPTNGLVSSTIPDYDKITKEKKMLLGVNTATTTEV
jgi:hypothetical protein